MCRGGYYLVASGARRGACEACSSGVSIEAILLVLFLLCCLVAGYLLGRSDLQCVRNVKAYIGDEEHWNWWKEQGKTLWLTAQTCSLFLDVETVAAPAPFSWLVSAMSFVTLGPLAAYFFSPCASSFAGRKSKMGRVECKRRR